MGTMSVPRKTPCPTQKGCKWGYLVLHRKKLEPRVLPWQQYSRCHFVSFVMYISGAKFEDHCSNICPVMQSNLAYHSLETGNRQGLIKHIYKRKTKEFGERSARGLTLSRRIRPNNHGPLATAITGFHFIYIVLDKKIS